MAAKIVGVPVPDGCKLAQALDALETVGSSKRIQFTDFVGMLPQLFQLLGNPEEALSPIE
jgi:arginase family enzyme